MAIALAPEDVFTPAAAVGLAMRAFAAAGLPDGERFDLTCSGKVLATPTLPRRLIPQRDQSARSLARLARRAMRWVRGGE
jgi:hypothetical protein